MVNKEKFELQQLRLLDDKEKKEVDNFILDGNTNGEFINTSNFLEYHEAGKFYDDSVIIRDKGSKNVRCVMMACAVPGEKDRLISHAGTTFAGPIINRRHSIGEISAYLGMLLDYYESNYETVELRLPPTIYGRQPFGIIDYMLLCQGYTYSMKALSNIINIKQIKSQEDALKLFLPKRRNQVKKIIKGNNFIFKEENNIRTDVWEAMNANLQKKFHAKTTHNLDEIRLLRKKFPDRIKAYYVDTLDGDYGAFCLAFKFKNVFHTQYLDTNYEYTGQYPNLLLIEKLVEEAANDGYDYFSFGASTENNGKYMNEGLYSYKADYGGGDTILPMYIKNCQR